MDYQHTLQQIGLTKTEASVYIAGLILGQALPVDIARKAGIKRPLLYKLLPGLKDKGLFSETVIGKRRYLVAEDPQTLLIEKRNTLSAFEDAVPELRTLLNIAAIKPKVTFYEGVLGIRKLYMETIKEKKDILEFVSLENISPEIEFHSRNYYIPQRINRRIPIKIIVSGKTASKHLTIKNDEFGLREVRMVDGKKFPIPLDCYIFGNNIALALYRKDSEPIGIIIHSIEVATFMRSLFNLVWMQAKESK